ncbi:MAG: DUF4097 family beta strand repeat protein [Clostridia bacterium]|nr:DUF4097 family beta strand repeat protein [Clostridia bacterium]
MTRKEYMSALEKALEFLGEEQRAALLEYYGEMIDDRMEDGMDEASAVAAMESPADIAAQQRTDEPKREAAPEADGETMTDEAMKFSSLAGNILEATEKILNQASGTSSFPKTAEESFRHEAERIRRKEEEMRQKEEAERQKADTVLQGKEAIRQAAETIRQEADKIRQEAEGSAQAQGFGEYRQQTVTCPADSLRAVSLTCGEMPIVVKTAEGSDVTLIYYTCDSDPYEAEARDGVLTLRRVESNNGGLARFTFSVLGGIMRMAWNKPSPTVELHVPENALLDLEARTSNASIKIKGPRALCRTELKTSNGRIALEHVKCKTLDAVNSNARLTLENVETKQSLNGKTSNGRIELDMVASGGDMILTTSNGRIEADNCSARGELRLTTSNGAIKADRLDGQSVTLKTSNSGITGTLPGQQSDWQIESGTSNGRSNLPNHQPGSKPLRVHTSNGSIDVKFEE